MPPPEEVAEQVAEEDAVSAAPPEAYVPVRFADVVVPLPSANPVVVLEEVDPPGRRLHIPIGLPEGVSIAYAARSMATPRPLTHDLVTSLLESFGLVLEVVRITGVRGTSFTAELVASGPGGTRTLDCRPSDGIALALRQRLFVPVVAAVAVLEAAGVAPAGETGPDGPEVDEVSTRDAPPASGS